jgi:hypothetical protein
MAMKRILEIVKDKLDVSSYILARRSGVSQAVLSVWKLKNSTTVNLGLLGRLRKVSGMTWAELGQIIDKEMEK